MGDYVIKPFAATAQTSPSSNLDREIGSTDASAGIRYLVSNLRSLERPVGTRAMRIIWPLSLWRGGFIFFLGAAA